MKFANVLSFTCAACALAIYQMAGSTRCDLQSLHGSSTYGCSGQALRHSSGLKWVQHFSGDGCLIVTGQEKAVTGQEVEPQGELSEALQMLRRVLVVVDSECSILK